MKISVFTVMLPDLTPEEAAGALAEASYNGVEWRVTRVPPERRGEPPSFWGNNLCTLEPTEQDADRASDLAEQAGLAIPCLGTYISVGDLNAVEEAMRFAQVGGAPSIRVGTAKTGQGSYRDAFRSTADFLTAVEPLAQRYGVKALVEIHHGTVIPSASAAYRLVSGFDPAAIGVIYDPGNMAREGYEDYRLGIELLGAHLTLVHLKNVAYDRPASGGIWQARWSPLEDGLVDFPALFAALVEAGYDGWLSIEDFSQARPSREALRHNVEFMRAML